MVNNNNLRKQYNLLYLQYEIKNTKTGIHGNIRNDGCDGVCHLLYRSFMAILPLKKTNMLYTINAGNHSANGVNFGIHSSGKTVSKTAMFNPDCEYDFGTNPNQFDINKLYGFSVGLFNDNHFNSARFGWRWSVAKQKIELLAYVYVNGVRINEWDADILLASVALKSHTYTEIAVVGSQYKFRAINSDDGVEVIKFLPRAGNGMGYNLYPYFGGNEVAPHTMTIQLD